MHDSPLAAVPLSQPHTACDVARGICRLFARNDIWCCTEMPLRNGRRADLMGIDAKGATGAVQHHSHGAATRGGTAQ